MWAVVTIPERESMADALIASLPQPVIKVLDQAGNLQGNHIRAWREVCERPADWVGVMQDDVLLCADFAAKVRRRLAEADGAGYRAISLFNSANSDAKLRIVSARWAQVDLPRMERRPAMVSGPFAWIKVALPGEQCVLVRREIALNYPDFALRHADLYHQFPKTHDVLFGLFLNSRMSGSEDLALLNENNETNHIYIAIPNLVNHRIEVPSSIGNANELHRASSTFKPEAD